MLCGFVSSSCIDIVHPGYADSYLSTKAISGQIGKPLFPHYPSLSHTLSNIAQQQNGSVVIIEHRFYGLSNPINDLKAESLKYHTIQQAIEDLEYFIKNVILPQPDGDKLTPDKAPWVLFGGSYSGK